MKFTLHNHDSAPEASKPLSKKVEKAYGFLPNLYAEFAESPVAISTYIHITEQLKEHGALTPKQQQIVMLAVSEDNGCGYCVAAHSMVAGMAGVPDDTVKALRSGDLPDAPQEAALVKFAKAALKHRGWIPEGEQKAFQDAGFTTRHALEVLSILALKTLSNYTNHLAHTPLDSAFEPYDWQKE